MNSIITKIWIIIAVLACTLGALLYWGAKSYFNSSQSIESIINPDWDSRSINSLYQYIIQSDLHFNNFILTEDSLQSKLADNYNKKIDSLISELENSTSLFISHKPGFDSLKAILQEKTRMNSILKDLKKRQNTQYFTKYALNDIKQQLSDSAFIDKAIVQRKDVFAHRDTVEQVDIIQRPDDFKGLGGFFRKIFGKEKIRIDTVVTLEEQVEYGLELSIDSSIVRDYFVDTTLAAVKEILVNVLDKEVRLQRQLNKTELEIITYNELLLQNIRDLLDEISQSNEAAMLLSQKSAKQKIEKTHIQAFISAGVGICIGFIFLFILIKDFAQTNSYRKRLEKEKERAEELAEAKELFLSKMSHEIRTPLHSISGFTQLLKKEIKEEDSLKFLQGISYANQYLNELVNNILEQAKINAGTFKLEPGKVLIPDLCREVEMILKPREEDSNVVFRLNYSQNLKDCLVWIDSMKLKQVLINLLGNAFNHTTKGYVSLDVQLLGSEGSNELMINVADTGTGINSNDHNIIFQPFNQVSKTSINHVNGTGLGLSISKHIIEHLGGEIQLESQPGKGSTFKIHIPVTCEPYVPVRENGELDEQHSILYPIHILAVEDDSWNAFLLENYLGPHIHNLKVYDNAEAALTTLKENANHYDLILTDLNLPGMDGHSFFKEIDKYSIPVIALSAGLSLEGFDHLMEQGFSDAIGKPFDQKDLLNSIGKLFTGESVPKKGIAQISSIESTSTVNDILGSGLFGDGNLKRFNTSHQLKISSFKEAIEKSDLKELARMAHQLKSNSEQVGVFNLSEALQTIEVFCEIGNKTRALEVANETLPLLLSVSDSLQAAK